MSRALELGKVDVLFVERRELRQHAGAKQGIPQLHQVAIVLIHVGLGAQQVQRAGALDLGDRRLAREHALNRPQQIVERSGQHFGGLVPHFRSECPNAVDERLLASRLRLQGSRRPHHLREPGWPVRKRQVVLEMRDRLVAIVHGDAWLLAEQVDGARRLGEQVAREVGELAALVGAVRNGQRLVVLEFVQDGGALIGAVAGRIGDEQPLAPGRRLG